MVPAFLNELFKYIDKFFDNIFCFNSSALIMEKNILTKKSYTPKRSNSVKSLVRSWRDGVARIGDE